MIIDHIPMTVVITRTFLADLVKPSLPISDLRLVSAGSDRRAMENKDLIEDRTQKAGMLEASTLEDAMAMKDEMLRLKPVCSNDSDDAVVASCLDDTDNVDGISFPWVSDPAKTSTLQMVSNVLQRNRDVPRTAAASSSRHTQRSQKGSKMTINAYERRKEDEMLM